MSSIVVIGTGYVGLITGAGFADLGNDVVCLDILEEKIAKLRAGTMPFFEPGLEELVRRTAEAGRLRFTTAYAEAIPGADFVFITVDTPPGGNGKADMSRVAQASRSLAPYLRGRTIIINKSTMPVGSGDYGHRRSFGSTRRRTPRSPSSPTPSSCARARRCATSGARPHRARRR